jgi:hypothetical protein
MAGGFAWQHMLRGLLVGAVGIATKSCAGLGDDKGDVAPNAERYEPSYLFDTPRGVAGFAWENLWERMLAGYRAAESPWRARALARTRPPCYRQSPGRHGDLEGKSSAVPVGSAHPGGGQVLLAPHSRLHPRPPEDGGQRQPTACDRQKHPQHLPGTWKGERWDQLDDGHAAGDQGQRGAEPR